LPAKLGTRSATAVAAGFERRRVVETAANSTVPGSKATHHFVLAER
jgi:hypothetical protein